MEALPFSPSDLSEDIPQTLQDLKDNRHTWDMGQFIVNMFQNIEIDGNNFHRAAISLAAILCGENISETKENELLFILNHISKTFEGFSSSNTTDYNPYAESRLIAKAIQN